MGLRCGGPETAPTGRSHQRTPTGRVVQILLGPVAGDDEFHLVVQIDGACPTGNTYAAGLGYEEPRVIVDTVQQVTRGIEDRDGAIARDVLVRDPASAVRRYRQTFP